MTDTAAPDLRERRRMATRSEISDAALTLFEAQGYDGTTIEDIAHAAGVSSRTCFRYFSNKIELVLTAAEAMNEAITEWLDAPDREAPLLDQLLDVYESIVSQVEATQEVTDQVLRVRRLMQNDASMRTAALARDVERAWDLTQRITASFGAATTPLEISIATEFAGATLRVAFDEWVREIESGKPSHLIENFRAVRSRVPVR
ncbi:TetR/AcrR family transcriptional regulator [Humidisolicoccus flavus]|uniref:TetR/AcrR family transcriptional regulator n=1 Tax=Humidisolicoccus flavus TaxID=3111414 RepID=UPI003247194E